MTCYIPVIYFARLNDLYKVRSIADSLVILANIAILLFLVSKLANFKTRDMGPVICSIYTQFFLLLASCLITMVIDFYFGFSDLEAMGKPAVAHAIVFLSEIAPLVPIIYVLYIHRQTFRRDTDASTAGS